MEELMWREPTEKDKKIVMEYRKECVEFGIPKSVGYPLKDLATYEEWFDKKTIANIKTKIFKRNIWCLE